MKYQKGKSGNPKGRPQGVPNKFTTLKQSFLNVYQRLGGDDALLEYAKTHKPAFYAMITKLFPQEHEHTGADGGPITFNVTWNGNGNGNGAH